MTDPQKDEHIEELLSKLQGIFGKLSHTEEEEAKPDVAAPAPAPDPIPFPLPDPIPEPEPDPTPAPPTDPMPTLPPDPIPVSQADPQPHSMPAPTNEPPGFDPMPFASAPAFTAAPPATEPPAADKWANTGSYETTVPLEDPEKMIVPTAVHFPPGRETEGKILAQKLETMTPKFTKVAFRLRVGVFMLYDPKTDWKEAIAANTAQSRVQAAFVLMDRPLDDAKRKATAADLEKHDLYFQEVLTQSIEKKAFYTDILLGLVFYFDSHKSSPEE